MRLNNINYIKSIFSSICIAVVLSGCSNDESPFSGNDNFISIFRLETGDKVWNAAVDGTSIILSVPESVSLDDASVTMVISENATISPDPATVTDWNTPHTFTVTSFNGTKRTYEYSIVRSSIVKEGNITLYTQADVETLAELNLNVISGSLTVGNVSGTDSVFSLEPLSTLKVIKGGILINPTYAGKDLKGLDNLEEIGFFNIEQNKKLENVSLPQLTRIVSDFRLNRPNIRVLDFPVLQSIERGIEVTYADSLATLNFPELRTVVQNVLLQGGWQKNNLKAIDFPKLEKIGGTLTITSWFEVKSVRFPALKNVQSVSISSLEKTESITIPQIEALQNELRINYLTQLKSFDLSKVKTIGGDLWLENLHSLENLDGLNSLADIKGQLYMGDLKNLKNSNGMKKLESVGGRFYLSRLLLSEDDNLNGFSNLSNVGGYLLITSVPLKKFTGFSLTNASEIHITGNEELTIEEIDVRNIEITGTLGIQSIYSPAIVKGPDICNYSLELNNANVQLSGFKEVNKLKVYVQELDIDRYVLDIEKVKGDASLQLLYVTDFKMPHLVSVDGLLNFSVYTGDKVDLSKLKTTGQATFDIAHLESFSVPALETVGGNLTVTTATYSADKLKELRFASLKTVNGIVSVSGYSSYYKNTNLKDLNGFASLQNVKGISINYNSALTDFSGLKNTLRSITAADWNVDGNGYNPTYADMEEGKWIKE